MKGKKKKEVEKVVVVSNHVAMLQQHVENKYYRRKDHEEGIYKIKHPPNTLK